MPKPTYILGISAYYHDSAAALLKDGAIVAAAQEERFTRKKNDASFPTNAVRYVLKEAALNPRELNVIAFYDKPFLKFERLLETYHAFVPTGLTSFFTSIPVWAKEKLFMRSMLRDALKEFLLDDNTPMYFPEHHLSHAASAFFPSPFEESAVLTIDGVGEWTTTMIGQGRGNSIEVLREIHFPHSLGLLYSTFTAYCGFKVNSGEYKLMGLAPYGNPDAERTRIFEKKIRSELIDIREDGSYLLNMNYFSYPVGLRMYHKRRWKDLFGIGPREAESDLEQEYMDMALAIQRVTEDVVLRLARTARDLTGLDNICLSGGVALNCVANGKLLRSGLFKGVWIQPASGDAGGALGAALAAWHIVLCAFRRPEVNDAMRGSYLGPAFSVDDIVQVCNRFRAPCRYIADESELCGKVSDLLAEGNVVGWFQGRMEYGPRALGNRSILSDPRNSNMQKHMNLKIKYREGFRPFAPSILEEDVSAYFDLTEKSPYMLLVAPVTEKICNPLPENYNDFSLWERLYYQRSKLPSITHIDYSARVQTVSSAINPRYHALLSAFKERHGCPVLLNTSFNVRDEPIICTPQEAYTCFMHTEMDYLVMGDFLLAKNDQPPPCEDLWEKGLSHDPILGYGPTPNGTMYASRLVKDDKVIYDVLYSRDSEGRRITPDRGNKVDTAILLFGCSFTVGEGLNDEDTFAWQLGELLGEKFQVFNYGFHGYGSHHMLALIESGRLDEIARRYEHVYAFYLTMSEHGPRCVGLAPWDNHGPRYILKKGTVKHAGKFNKTSIGKLNFVNYFFNMLKRHKWLMAHFGLNTHAAIIAKSMHELKNRYHAHALTIIWPDYTHIEPLLRDRGVRTLSLKSAMRDYASSPEKYSLLNDGHPNAQANTRIAEVLAEYVLKKDPYYA